MTSERWADIGREVSEEARVLSKADRVAFQKQKAMELGIAPHTLGRYVVLSKFLEELHVPNQEANDVPVSITEIIYRMHSLSKDKALSVLKKARKHTITYREAQSELNLIQPRTDSRNAISMDRDRLLDIAAGILNIDVEGISLEVSVEFSTKISFEIAVLKCKLGSVAFMDEDSLASSYKRGSLHFMRGIIITAAKFDIVLVHFSSEASEKFYRDRSSEFEESVIAKVRILPQAISIILN